MWSSKAKLIEKASEIAEKKHPEGYNKEQLIDASKEVYGGFGITQVNPLMTRKIETMDNVQNMGNAMANIDGHYPVGMSGCYVVGLNGGCGLGCPVYLNGDCDDFGDMCEDMTGDEIERHIKIYGSLESAV